MRYLLLLALIQNPVQEVSQQDAGITFESRVSEVPVTVVVRDKSGKPVDGLTKADFALFDKGKPQIISRLTVERSEGSVRTAASTGNTVGMPAATTGSIPERFTAFYFDDVHLTIGSLSDGRKAVEKYLAAGLKPTERAALYTSSGQGIVDFTDKTEDLLAGLARLRTRPVTPHSSHQCPALTFYQSDLIVNQHDPAAFRIAELETMQCLHLYSLDEAGPLARNAAQTTIEDGDHETRLALDGLRDLVRRIATMPGRRLILMVSPGFLRLTMHEEEESQIIDRASKAGVVISSVDARGLYTDAAGQPGKVPMSPQVESAKTEYDRMQNRSASDPMAELASGTGGTLFENSNDLDAGVQLLSAPPEVSYTLGFTPLDLKPDGSFHALKVSLPHQPGLVVKARRGYYAPNHTASAEEQMRDELAQALFSREESSGIPADIRTQYLKLSDEEARLTVTTRIDVRKLRFRKIDGRNGDEMIVVSGLFDHNGNFLKAVSKKVDMRIKDETLATRLNGGVAVHADFKVAPGHYLVRMVVRDSEGQAVATQNGSVDIP